MGNNILIENAGTTISFEGFDQDNEMRVILTEDISCCIYLSPTEVKMVISYLIKALKHING